MRAAGARPGGGWCMQTPRRPWTPLLIRSRSPPWSSPCRHAAASRPARRVPDHGARAGRQARRHRDHHPPRRHPGLHAGDDDAVQGEGPGAGQGSRAGRPGEGHAGGDRRGALAVAAREDRLGAVPGDGRARRPPSRCWSRASRSRTRPSSTRTATRSGCPSLQGSAVLVTFIYTRCPLPDFCPRMDRQFAAVQQAVRDGRTARGVRLLSISFDPDHDTPGGAARARRRASGADPAHLDVCHRPPRPGGRLRRASRPRRHPGPERPVRHHPQPPDGRHRSAGPAGDRPQRQRLERRGRACGPCLGSRFVESCSPGTSPLGGSLASHSAGSRQPAAGSDHARDSREP